MAARLLCHLAIFTAMFVFDHFAATAQEIDENSFAIYTRQQGLSGNFITGMVQDSTGFIWTSTTSGLNRFNGSNFIQFHSENDSLSLPSEYIRGLVQLDKRRICSFGDGLHIIDTYTGKARNLFIPYSEKKYQYKFNWIFAVKSNTAGDIFVMARSGFYHFNKNYQLVYRYDHYPKEEVATSSFVFGRYLLMLDQKHLVIISSTGIYYYDAGKKEFRKIESGDCTILNKFIDYPSNDCQFFQRKPGRLFVLSSQTDSLYYIDVTSKRIISTTLPFAAARDFDYHSQIAEINDTLFYIAGKNSGFYKINLAHNKSQVRFFPRKYFSSYSCRDILKDHDDNLWVATSTGLLHEVRNKAFVRRIEIPSQLLNIYPNISISALLTTKDNILAATYGGGGLLVFDKKTHQFIRRIGFENCYRQPEQLFALSPVDENSVLVGTNGPLFKVDINKGTIKEIHLAKWSRDSGWIADICVDQKKNMWISSEKLYKYNKQNNTTTLVPLPPDFLQKIEWTQILQQDASGNLWLAGHGLLRYNTSSEKLDRFVDSFPFIKIPDRQINIFIADGQNNLWINTNNNGLFCYNIQKQTFRHFTRDNGLPENNIASMIVIGGKLWLATFSGICCLDIKTSTIFSFGKEDGFPDQPITKGSKFFYDSATNKLYIGFTSSLLEFDPAVAFEKIASPRLFIESFATNYSEKFLPHENDFTTNWRDNEIKITIGSINFSSSSSQHYAFRLVDDNNGWQNLGSMNSFNISSLSPGHHKVQVKLYSVANRWPSQIKEFDIVVLPPFWEKNWFYYSGIFLLIIIIYILVKWRINTVRKKEQEKTHIQKIKAEEYKIQFELEQISNYFSSSFADKRNVDDVLWDVSKNLIGWLNYEDCMIYMWNKDHTRMIQKAWYGPKGDPGSPHITVFDVLPGQGVVGHVMVTKEPLIVPDTTKDNRYRVDDAFRLSEICVPIIHDDELIGIIDSEHSQANHYNERDIKILTTIATLVSNKIKQIESEQSLLAKQKEILSINQQLAEAQLLALQTQMNPHFLFNSLNGIKGMILDNEQQRASRYMTKFANLLRITLNQSKEVFTTLCENMEQLENYLAMEKLRFDDSFTFRITADKHIDQEETLIPTMMIQPLAENAIWHGLMPKKGNKKLSIHFSMMNDMIYCAVEDNGIGLRNSERLKKMKRPLHESLGLTNLRNRIKILNEKYDTGCSLELFDLQDINNDQTGSCAVLSFKMITSQPIYESNIN
jgi:ligand-binding sensor domain-containing protein/putative methionine-R-sulfoxide reductase with GAF domain